MKILIVSHEYPPIGGGGANACYFLTREYVKLGHDVTVVTSCFKNVQLEEYKDGFRLVRVKAMRKNEDKCNFIEMLTFLLSALRKCNALMKKEKYEVCQIFFGIPSGPIGWYLKKKYHVPYIVRFGGGDIPGTQKRFDLMYKVLAPFIRTIWREADYLVANSEGLMQRALDFEKKYPIEVISNGVDFDFFSYVDRKEKNNIEILFVSRLIERKGLQYVIPYMKQINQKLNRSAHLTVVGDGPYRATLELISKKNNAESFVSFVGKKNKEEVRSFYQKADMFILPSKWEGMPNVVLEAMSTGLPIVMSPCEGSKELMHNNGYVVPTELFPDSIVQMCDNKKQMLEMGKHSFEIVKSKFTWMNTAVSYEKLFKKMTTKEK